MTKVPLALRRVQPQIAAGLRLLTRMVGPLTRGLSPFVGTRGVPTHSARSTLRYATERSSSFAQVHVVRVAEHLKRTAPDGIPPDHWRFMDEAEYDLPEGFVVDLPEGKVLGDLGAVMTADGTLLFDVSPYFAIGEPRNHPIFRRALLPPEERIEGSAAVLSTRGDENFYHFMLDVLPRLGLLEDARSLDSIDAFIVRHNRPYHRELLELCSVASNRILDTTEHRHVRAQHLIVPSIPALHSETPAWVVEFLRTRLMPSAPITGTRPTRFYVSRGTGRRTRAVVNEEAVIETLAGRGIVPVALDGMPILEQVALFRDAELIVSPHGAGLTNVAFCAPGATVVEVFGPSYVNVCFWKLCSQVEGVEYRYVLGAGPSPAPEHDLKGVSVDITVDLDRLASILDLSLV